MKPDIGSERVILEWHVLFMLICIAGLAGCASKHLVGTYVPGRTACCSQLSDIHFHTLTPGQETEFSLTSESPAFAFGERRQHFVALKMPDGFRATTIHVTTYLSSSYLPLATALVPEFIFNDAAMRTIASATTETLQPAGGFWRSGVSGRVTVPAGTRFIVLIPSDGRMGRPQVFSENVTPYVIPPVALGSFSLRLFGEPATR